MATLAAHAGAAAVARAKALRGVLDDRDATMPLGDRVYGVHVAHLAVKAYRHDRPRVLRDGGLDFGGIHQASVRLDVDEHWTRAQQHDHLGGGGEREWRRDDLVARPMPSAIMLISSASVPEAQVMQCCAPV